MAEHSGFFDAHYVDNAYDRVYLAEHFAKYFASFIGNGIFAGKSNELMVKQKDKPDMSVKVLSGKGWINGYYYENDDELSLTFDISDGLLNRIDLIVLRWSNSERNIRAYVKKGTSASKPSAPTLQRDDDVYELKLAEIYIAAGIVNITQVSITDTRLNTDVCGVVHAVVDQLDATEFGAQLNAYVTNFMNDNDEWFEQFKIDSNALVNNLISTNQVKIDALLSSGREDINDAINDGNTRLNKLLSDYNTEFSNALEGYETIKNNSQTEINRLIAELEDVVNGNDVAQLNTKVESILTQISGFNTEITNIKNSLTGYSSSISNINTEITNIKNNITNITKDVTKLKGMFIESSQYPGCFYRLTSSNDVEWVNPPNIPGFEYITTERWNNKLVYRKVIYIGSLPNKTMMTIDINSAYNNIISISGFAIDSDNNMYYPFPIILNGLTPSSVIAFAEGDGGDGSTIAIQTNDDISSFVGYIIVKYTK